MRNDDEHDQDRERLRAWIVDAAVTMLTTIDCEKRPATRPMLPLLLDDDSRIHFLTQHSSAKVAQVHTCPDVCIAMACSGGVYLSLTGKAKVSRDPQLLDQLWRSSYRAWFPDGRHDPEIAVLSVTLDCADVWEAPTSPVTRLFGAARALITHQPFETSKQRFDDPLQSGGGERR